MAESDPQASEVAAPAAGAAGGEGRRGKGETETIELGKRAEAYARRVAESKATIPHLYLERNVALGSDDASGLGARALGACARALRRHPRLNASYRDGAIHQHERVNVGVVVETADGPLIPVLRDAEAAGAAELEARLAELEQAAGEGRISSPDLAGGTFTITVLASGADRALPTVTPGQAGHLAVGAPRDSGRGTLVTLSLACDGRAVGAGAGAAFLATVAEEIGDA